MITTSPDTIATKIQSLLGDDCKMIKGSTTDPESLKKSRWVLECSDKLITVFHKGQVLGTVNQTDLSLSTEIGCNAENVADAPHAVKQAAQEWVDQEMLPTWQKRGYEIDINVAPHEWDPLERLWIVSVIKTFESPEALAMELYWVSEQELLQFIQ